MSGAPAPTSAARPARRAAVETAPETPVGGVRCVDLRVEHLDAPLGLATARPRFSWRVTGDPLPRRQAAYEVEVAEVAADGSPGELLWASGRVEGDPLLVEHAGPPLRPATAHAWRVRAWGDDEGTEEGPGPWATAGFETALLRPDDWSAAWVRPVQEPTAVERWTLLDWVRGAGPDSPPGQRLRPVQLVRQRFDAPAPDGTGRPGRAVVRARLHATAHGVFTARLNGQEVGDEVLAPGFDTYEHRLPTRTHDVTDLVRPGENVLGLALADGWWAGRIGLTGSSAQWGASTSAIWQLHLDHADGTTTVVLSGADARSAPGPWAYADLFVGEHHDARAEPVGWSAPGFDDTAWTPVELSGESLAALVPAPDEPVRRVGELAPVSITPDRDDPAAVVVDFGQVVAGRVRLALPAARAGQVVTIEHTEVLLPDGGWFANVAGINKEQTDTHVAAGPERAPGGEVWEPVFTFHGFRYARLRGLDRPPAPGEVTAVVLSSDLRPAGSFWCSDPRLTRLHENVVWSQRANFLSVPTDCPQRERAGWTGDLQVFAPAAVNNADVTAFLARWLATLRADALPDGRVPVFSPRSPFDAEAAAAASGIGGIVACAGWSDAIAIVPWVLWERSGDLRVLEDNYDAIVAWAAHQRRAAAAELPASLAGRELHERRRADRALLFDGGDAFGDWLTPSTLRGRPLHEAIGIAPALTAELVGPLFQVRTLDLAARIATVLGRDDDAREHAAHAARVRAAFTAEHLRADGSLGVDLQGPHVLALAFDVVPPERRQQVADHLAALVARDGDRLDTGFLSVAHLLDVLWETGHRDLARRVLRQSEQPSWLYQVDRGATTVWESWDAVAPDGAPRAVSFNHYAYGCVDDWLYRRVAGIGLSGPGATSLRVDPDLACGVEEVRAHVDVPRGRVAVRWALRRGGDGTAGTDGVDGAGGGWAEVVVSVPPGVDAVLATPAGDLPLPVGESTHHLPLPTPERP